MSLEVSTELDTLRQSSPDHPTRSSTPTQHLSHMPKRPPIDIEFNDISYTVPSATGSKLILRNISGLFRSGHLTAILGPSGAGKSSLLNILAGYKSQGSSGTILINGEPRDMSLFKKLSRYIMQEDLIQPNFSVEECMWISAELKLGKSRTKEQKLTTIDEILVNLRLNNCRKTMTSRLSGGERKRLSIALELVNNPPVIFLDEPTTGLDDLSSSQCVSLLKLLAEEGRTIICSIHTPSARLFAMFDHVYVVAQGSCVFQGSGMDIVPFLQTHGLTCPTTYNPADFVIEVSSGEYGNHIEKMVTAIDNGKIYKWRRPNEDKTIPQPTSRLTPVQNFKDEYNFSSSGWFQFFILLKRMLTQTVRDREYLIMISVMYIFLAFMVSIMYYGMGNDGSKTLFNFGFCFCCLIVFLYVPLLPVLLQFPTQVKLLKREYFNRWYGLTSYFFALSISRLPAHIIFPMSFTAIVYYFTNQPPELYRYFLFCIFALLTSCVSESFGLVLSSFLNVVNGVFVGPSLAVPLILLAVYGLGFGPGTTPLYMKFFMNLSFLRYGLEGLVTAIYGYDRPNLDCPDKEDYCHYRNPKALMTVAGMENINVWVDVVALIFSLILFRGLTFFLLRYRLSTGKKIAAIQRITRLIKDNFDITKKYSY